MVRISKRVYGALLMSGVAAIPAFTACTSDPAGALCCTEFKVGAQISADIGGGAESQVAVQAVADFAGIASASIDDLTTACRAMAQDLDAKKEDIDAAEAKADKTERMTAMCAVAVTSIKASVTAAGSLKIVAKAPQCQASVSAKANCQAKCSGSASCDLKANPPKCTGGKLEVACKGECTAEGGATLHCEGSCTTQCKGSCTAKGGVAVKCDGKCDGTCAADASGTGNGIQADGSCKGTCQGTCTARADAPAVECSGSCNGECTGTCKAEANAQVKCDGKCNVDAEPLKCEGGKLEGGCKAEAKCDANCDASVQAKAECTPPSIDVQFSAVADANVAAKLEATLKANLGTVLAFKSRLDAMVKVGGTLTGNVQALTDIKAACIPAVGGAALDAAGQVKASFDATVSIAGAVGAT